MMDKCWVCLDPRGLIYVSENQVGASYSTVDLAISAVGAYCPTRPLDSEKSPQLFFLDACRRDSIGEARERKELRGW